MKQFTMQRWIYVAVAIIWISCGHKTSQDQFEVNGTITNNTARMIYLEEVPAGSAQGTIVDSSAIARDGRYKLKTETKEALVYNLRLDQNEYPLALAVVNDVPRVTLDIALAKNNGNAVEKSDIKGSPASQQLKDFMSTFNDDLHKIYFLGRQVDSLHKKNVPDSLMTSINTEWKLLAGKIRDFSLNSIKKSENPALFLFELGYYQ